MKKFLLTIVLATVALPFIVGCGKKEEVVAPVEISEEMNNSEELAQAGSEEASDSKENYEA
ncbi:MAG: hypothetical protein NTU89_00265 [Candidatus Dependentiae bacterium]|nr:hypothetical protein [Candidatus Dependentiae bacterium]